jgi:hypothetical protein
LADTANALAFIQATGIDQLVTATDAAKAYVLNGGGTILVSAGGHATDESVLASAKVSATATGISQDVFAGNTAQATFDNDGSLIVVASAVANGNASATANANARGVLQDVTAAAVAGKATALVTNIITGPDTGLIDVQAKATADAIFASATARAFGIDQEVDGFDAHATVVNEGTINVGASASAKGFSPFASASIWGIDQDVAGGAVAVASVDSTGDFNILATASAIGTSAKAALNGAQTTARVVLWGISQDASAVDADNAVATAKIVNDGTMDWAAKAFASGYDAFAGIPTASGIEQFVEGQVTAGAGAGVAVANALIVNDGTISINADATARNPGLGGGGFATATADISWIIDQSASASATDPTALARIDNNDSIYGEARALAFGGDVDADARSRAIQQDANANSLGLGVGTASAIVVNNGTISAIAFAGAVGTVAATAQADASGISQSAQGDHALVSVVQSNLAVLNASAVANAFGGNASATAFATGISQNDVVGVLDATAKVVNAGDILVFASAFADGAGNATSASRKTRAWAMTDSVLRPWSTTG